MRIGVAREAPGETLVALLPQEVKRLVGSGHSVSVQAGAGAASYADDDQYTDAGATLVAAAADVYEQSSVVFTVNVPTMETVAQLSEGTVLVGFLWPLQNLPLVSALAEKKITAIAVDSTPRISRAQSMDARSAFNTVAGYKAVLLGADRMPRFCPLLMTASGTIRPARLLVLGAGVAGLVAIGAGRRLGAIVEAFDVRPAVREQVESLGATYIDFDVDDAEDKAGYAKELDQDQRTRQLALIHEHIVRADLVITTALIPGREAPVLVTDEMLRAMKPGAVVVDMAAASGGNCVASKPDEEVVAHGVIIMGPTNLPAKLPVHASQMYSKVVTRLLAEVTTDEGELDFDNEILQGCCITHDGEVVHPATRSALEPGEAPK